MAAIEGTGGAGYATTRASSSSKTRSSPTRLERDRVLHPARPVPCLLLQLPRRRPVQPHHVMSEPLPSGSSTSTWPSHARGLS